MKKVCIWILLAISPLLAWSVPAQDSTPGKIVVVNVDLVVLESTRGKSFIARIELERNKKEKLIKEKEALFNNLQKKYENEKFSMNEEARLNMEREISDKKMQYQRYLEDQEIEMRRIYELGLKELQEEIVPIMEDLSQREGYILVLNKMQSGIVFAHDSIDITDKLIAAFDAKAKPDAAGGDSTE